MGLLIGGVAKVMYQSRHEQQHHRDTQLHQVHHEQQAAVVVACERRIADLEMRDLDNAARLTTLTDQVELLTRQVVASCDALSTLTHMDQLTEEQLEILRGMVHVPDRLPAAEAGVARRRRRINLRNQGDDNDDR